MKVACQKIPTLKSSKIKIAQRQIPRLTKKEEGRISRLHLQFGDMMSALWKCQELDSGESRIIMASVDDIIRGWALVDYTYYPPRFHVYVQKAFRLNGIGQKILNRALKYVKKTSNDKLRVFPWDNISREFFLGSMKDHVEADYRYDTY